MDTIDPDRILNIESPIDLVSAVNRSFALESINMESMSFINNL